MRYAAIIEKTGNGYSAYVPDLPGCVVAGDSSQEVESLIREAVALHVDMLLEHGGPVPEPQTSAAFVDVSLTEQELSMRKRAGAEHHVDRVDDDLRKTGVYPVDRVAGILDKDALGKGVSVDDYIEEIRGR